MFSSKEGIFTIVIVGTVMLVLLALFIITFFLFSQKRYNLSLLDKANLKADQKQELLKSKIEVQDATFKQVSLELHDNICQIISFVKLSLANIHTDDIANQSRVNECKELLGNVLVDLRDLSKSMSLDFIENQGLINAISRDIERIDQLGIYEIDFSFSGLPFSLGKNNDLIIYRIFQESIQNILKHAQATTIEVNVSYQPCLFTLLIKDNGKGFYQDGSNNNLGSGLKNIANRAHLINAELSIDAAIGQGCSIQIILDPKHLNPDEKN